MSAKRQNTRTNQQDLFGLDLLLEIAVPKSISPIPLPLPSQKQEISVAQMPQFSTEHFQHRLRIVIGEAFKLILTRNRTSLISFKRVQGELVIRMQEAFLGAPEQLIVDLGKWIKSPRGGAPKSIREFAGTIIHPEVRARSRKLYHQSETKVHDLKILYDKVNQEFFEGKIEVDITYGRDSSRQKVNVRRLGSFSRRQKLITIHPLLDDPRVPELIITFTIFHEMLHALQPDAHKRPHDKAFRIAEKQHPEYEKVMAWRKKNDRFLRGHGKVR